KETKASCKILQSREDFLCRVADVFYCRVNRYCVSFAGPLKFVGEVVGSAESYLFIETMTGQQAEGALGDFLGGIFPIAG
ncbi:MAG: hypothetical protein ABW068_17925, partial [Candidatus Thiodiazotropha sp.]